MSTDAEFKAYQDAVGTAKLGEYSEAEKLGFEEKKLEADAILNAIDPDEAAKDAVLLSVEAQITGVPVSDLAVIIQNKSRELIKFSGACSAFRQVMKAQLAAAPIDQKQAVYNAVKAQFDAVVGA